MLVSIAREMQSREDSNIMEAWRNGGEFQGHQVTDEQVLRYWTSRESSLSKDDPAYDTIKSNIMQLHYGIEQSKQDLLHVQGKISDSQYAQFYLKWAKKVPKNGEFWRVLQKDAAGLMESAKQKAKAAADKAKVDAFNAFTKKREGDITLGNAITKAVQDMANETGLDLEANGDRLLELLTQDYAKNPTKYHALTDAVKAAGGDFNGTFTHTWVGAQVSSAEQAYGDIATRAHKDGYTEAYNNATNGQASMTSWAGNMGSWSVSKTYDAAYSAFNKVWSDPHASFKDKNAAAAVFAGVAGKLAETPGLPTAMVTMLQADQKRALGEDAGDSPSFGAVTQHPGIDANIATQVATTKAAEDLMKANPGQYGYAPLTKDGRFDPTGQGPVGIIANSDVPHDAVTLAVPGLNGQASMVAVQPRGVFVKDPNDPNSKPVQVGQVISYGVGGQTVTMYGVRDGSDTAHWMLRNPFADNVTASYDDSGNMILTPPATDPATRAAALDAKYGSNTFTELAKQAEKNGGKAEVTAYRRDENGKVISKDHVTYENGHFTATSTVQTYGDPTGTGQKPQLVDGVTTTLDTGYNGDPDSLKKLITAPSLWNSNGANVPGSYTSPIAASVGATDQTMSSAQVAALAKDPAFQHAFVQQEMQSLDTQNPLDPRVISAWHQATDKSLGLGSGTVLPNGMTVSPTFAGGRSDLAYPGAAAQAPNETSASITFGGQTLKVPGLPGYVANNGAPPDLNLTPLSDFLGGAARNAGNFLNQVLQPGQAAGTPTVNGSTGFTTPTPTPTPTTTAVPTSTPAATPTPTATPAPTSAPVAPKADPSKQRAF